MICPSLVAGRKVAQFGFRYDYEAQAVDPTPVGRHASCDVSPDTVVVVAVVNVVSHLATWGVAMRCSMIHMLTWVRALPGVDCPGGCRSPRFHRYCRSSRASGKAATIPLLRGRPRPSPWAFPFADPFLAIGSLQPKLYAVHCQRLRGKVGGAPAFACA